jgi:uncharacterized membrane protein (UPF0127 family)
MDCVRIAGKEIPVLLAISNEEQERGLMHQSWPPPAMAFIYGEPRQNCFWMKNTPSALDILFCRANKVIGIRKGEPNSTMLIGSELISDLVIELPFGTCKSHGIKEGHEITLSLEPSSQMRVLSSKVLGF